MMKDIMGKFGGLVKIPTVNGSCILVSFSHFAWASGELNNRLGSENVSKPILVLLL